jgi:broad specificity phosphatase PhoE
MKPESTPPDVCRVLLVRHAVARGHGRFHGHTDAPLAPAARPQLRALVEKLAPYAIDAIYASDLKRARATARAVARATGHDVIVRPALREMHFGKWEGLSWDEVVRQFPRLSKTWADRFPDHPIPGAERLPDFKRRLARELRAIVAANAGRCVLVVAHAGVARVVLAKALGLSDRHAFRLAQDPCGLNVIDYFPPSRSGQGSALVRTVNR